MYVQCVNIVYAKYWIASLKRWYSVVSVSCFGVRVSVMFDFMFVNYTLSSVWVAEGHLLGNICPLG